MNFQTQIEMEPVDLEPPLARVAEPVGVWASPIPVNTVNEAEDPDP